MKACRWEYSLHSKLSESLKSCLLSYASTLFCLPWLQKYGNAANCVAWLDLANSLTSVVITYDKDVSSVFVFERCRVPSSRQKLAFVQTETWQVVKKQFIIIIDFNWRTSFLSVYSPRRIEKESATGFGPQVETSGLVSWCNKILLERTWSREQNSDYLPLSLCWS